MNLFDQTLRQQSKTDAVTAQLVPGCGIDLGNYTSAADIETESLSKTWLVEGMLEAERVYQVFGEWKSGKTLAVMDLCGHLAAGLPEWAGKRITPALVVWVAGESMDDIKARLQGFMRRRGVSGEDMAFWLRDKPVGLSDDEHAMVLMGELARFRMDHPETPIVLVVDTLARNFGPGDENSTSDMGRFIDNLLDVVARPTQATVLVVHHSGHGAKDRGRGASAFPAACDGSLKVQKRDTQPAEITVEATEMRSVADGGAAWFRIDTVELGHVDNFSNPIVVPVLHALDGEPRKVNVTNLGPAQRNVMQELETLLNEARTTLRVGGYAEDQAKVTLTDWQDRCQQKDLVKSRQQFYSIKLALVDRGLVKISGEWADLTSS